MEFFWIFSYFLLNLITTAIVCCKDMSMFRESVAAHPNTWVVIVIIHGVVL